MKNYIIVAFFVFVLFGLYNCQGVGVCNADKAGQACLPKNACCEKVSGPVACTLEFFPIKCKDGKSYGNCCEACAQGQRECTKEPQPQPRSG